MLTIRMQRTGRKGHAMFRVVVQDSRRTPTSGNVVALIGNYDPHTKATNLAKDKAKFYLEHGAQPSDRVARLLKSEGMELPKWVKLEVKEARATRNPEKLRKNRPAEPEVEAPATVDEAEAVADTEASEPEQVAETVVSEDAPAEEPAAEKTETKEASSNKPEEQDTPTPTEETADKPVEPTK